MSDDFRGGFHSLDPRGVWVAFYSDRSGIASFGTEIDALRFAVDHGMEVQFRPFGADLFTGKEWDER